VFIALLRSAPRGWHVTERHFLGRIWNAPSLLNQTPTSASVSLRDKQPTSVSCDTTVLSLKKCLEHVYMYHQIVYLKFGGNWMRNE
jgi:hypothetical protein